MVNLNCSRVHTGLDFVTVGTASAGTASLQLCKRNLIIDVSFRGDATLEMMSCVLQLDAACLGVMLHDVISNRGRAPCPTESNGDGGMIGGHDAQ